MYDLLNVEKMLTKPKKNKCFKDSSVLNGRTLQRLALIFPYPAYVTTKFLTGPFK